MAVDWFMLSTRGWKGQGRSSAGFLLCFLFHSVWDLSAWDGALHMQEGSASSGELLGKYPHTPTQMVGTSLVR